MKKLLSLILVTLMFVCGFGFVGCKEDEGIEYTAEKPLIGFGGQTAQNGYELVARFNSFTEFSEYYSANLKGRGFYLLNRDGEKLPLIPPEYGYFAVFKNNETEEVLLEENYDYLDEELGSKPNKDNADGFKAVSIHFDIYIINVGTIDTNELVLEFGILEIPYYWAKKYINIYYGEKCFATCYYSNYVTVPREWFENYFKTNLIYGDDL